MRLALAETLGLRRTQKKTQTTTTPINSDNGMTAEGAVAQSMNMNRSNPAAVKRRYCCHCSSLRRWIGRREERVSRTRSKWSIPFWYADDATFAFANHIQVSSRNMLHCLHVIKLQPEVRQFCLTPKQIIRSDLQVIRLPTLNQAPLHPSCVPNRQVSYECHHYQAVLDHRFGCGPMSDTQNDENCGRHC